MDFNRGEFTINPQGIQYLEGFPTIASIKTLLGRIGILPFHVSPNRPFHSKILYICLRFKFQKMKTELTKQDILDLLDRQAKEHQQRLLESDLRFDARIEKSRLELEASIEKSRLELDESLKKSRIEFESRHKEFDENLKRSQKESEKSRKDFNKRLGEVTGVWGKFVAEMVKPRIIKMFKDKGILIKTALQNVVGLIGDKKYYEIDLLLINSQIAVAVEIKSSLSVDDVKEHLERLERIQRVQPEKINMGGTTLYGAVAGIIVENDADKFAYKHGLFVLRQKGSIVQIMNDKAFVPKEWKVEY